MTPRQRVGNAADRSGIGFEHIRHAGLEGQTRRGTVEEQSREPMLDLPLRAGSVIERIRLREVTVLETVFEPAERIAQQIARRRRTSTQTLAAASRGA